MYLLFTSKGNEHTMRFSTASNETKEFVSINAAKERASQILQADPNKGLGMTFRIFDLDTDKIVSKLDFKLPDLPWVDQ
jgi:hypothetical protein